MVLMVIAPITGVIGNTVPFILSKHFKFDIVIYAVVSIPFVSQLIAVLFGQDKMPGARTFGGLCIITAGLIICNNGNKTRIADKINEIIAKHKKMEDYSLSQTF